MESNCCLLVGNFKNESEFLNSVNNPSAYINFMIDFNKKVIEPNNCDIFIYTDYNVDYELIYPPALTETTVGIFHNNLKKIFKNKLKSFKIQSNELLNKSESSNFFYSNINNDKDNKFNLTLAGNNICFQTFKLMKNYEICKKYQLDNNVKYNKYFVCRPDFSIQHTLLFTQFNDNNCNNYDLFDDDNDNAEDSIRNTVVNENIDETTPTEAIMLKTENASQKTLVQPGEFNNVIHIAFNSWLLFNDDITLEKYINEFTENLENHCLKLKSSNLILSREHIQMCICYSIAKFKLYHYNDYGSTADCRRCCPYLKDFYSEEDIKFFSKQIDEII